MNENAEVAYVDEKSVRTMEKLGEFRLIAAYQHPQTLGPTLQEAYRCREDGRISWRTVGIQWMSVEEYHEQTR